MRIQKKDMFDYLLMIKHIQTNFRSFIHIIPDPNGLISIILFFNSDNFYRNKSSNEI